NDYDQLQSLAALKALNPNVRVLVSVGGWNFCTAQGPFLGTGSDAVFPAVALSPELTANLLRSVVSFCETHGLDGVDIDWEDAVSPNIARLAAALKSGLASKGLLLTVTLPGQYQSLQRLDPRGPLAVF
ncbi:glycoside hydrolase superfamily, partial [Zopfochytrium polystomum]